MKMNKEKKEILAEALEVTWDILDQADHLLRGSDAPSVEEQRPDFSALIHALTAEQMEEVPEYREEAAAPAAVPEVDEMSISLPETPVSDPDPEPLPSYASSCRNLAEVAWAVGSCTRCGLGAQRTNPVPGAGVMNPKVFVIGEAPGAEEDKTGEPFVGKAGKYLDSWMGAIKLYRGRDLFIGNIIKCRPPNNRDPFPDEQACCLPFIRQQIRILKPKAILCVGRIAAQILTGSQIGIGRMRGNEYFYEGIPLMVTYHPAAVLRNPQEYRAPVWDDLQRLHAIIS